jgi:hypothetical protein
MAALETHLFCIVHTEFEPNYMVLRAPAATARRVHRALDRLTRLEASDAGTGSQMADFLGMCCDPEDRECVDPTSLAEYDALADVSMTWTRCSGYADFGRFLPGNELRIVCCLC